MCHDESPVQSGPWEPAFGGRYQQHRDRRAVTGSSLSHERNLFVNRTWSLGRHKFNVLSCQGSFWSVLWGRSQPKSQPNTEKRECIDDSDASGCVGPVEAFGSLQLQSSNVNVVCTKGAVEWLSSTVANSMQHEFSRRAIRGRS